MIGVTLKDRDEDAVRLLLSMKISPSWKSLRETIGAAIYVVVQ